ncbi:A-kinase anchor protein 17A [Fukomys damarensis]|uniref:A-kinase anchor protein 17A n=1 Tax=Fukomys damarensis TaxID=885580 RepID=A0A091CVZ8_FUKDA|nr:A-kinase anchor protein 17A [Fukomys damarensis]
MAAATIVHDTSEAVELCAAHGLYLKPITKMSISVALPQLKQPGKSISNWEVMERLKGMVHSHQFSTLRISKSTMDFIRFEGEVENRGLVKAFLACLDGKTIKLSGFSDILRVRAAEFKLDFPTRHDWDSFFRDAEDMNETLPGERPDTIHLEGLPCKCEEVLVRVFRKFGEIRSVDIPMLDPYREEMTGRNFHTFSFGGHLNFEAYVQYREYAGFIQAMSALRGMKLMYKGDDGKAVACNIKVVFAACELGVFDLLATAPGPLDVGTVCTRLGTSFHGTELLLDACVALKLLTAETRTGKAPGPLDVGTVCTRLGTSFHGTELLLDACVALKLLTAETRTGKAVYGNTELSGAYLTSLSPTSQVHMLLYLARTTYRCWGHLAEAVREGKNQYEKAFAVPSGDLFTAIYRSEGERLLFMRGLQEVWSVSGSRVLAAFDLSRFPHICDLGGGSGALARVCASLYPAAKVTVFDTPEVVGTAETHFPAPTEGQLVFQAGEAAWETRFRGGSSAPGAVQGACGDPRGFSAVSSALWFLSPRKVCD